MRYIFIPFLAVVLLFQFGFSPLDANNYVKGKVVEMISKNDEIKTMSFTMKKKERTEGEFRTGEVQVKLQKEPYKVYMKQVHPDPGMEILFIKGWNNNRALINPNKFPWVNVSLDPMGGRMRSGQHHTILQTGFDYVFSILSNQMEAEGDKLSQRLKHVDNVTWQSKACFKIEYNNPNFAFVDYTVKEHENLVSLARRKGLSEYMILEKNEHVDWYTDVEAGTKIKLPNVYAKRMEIWVEKATGLPLLFRIHDNQGVFEEYEYLDLKVNPNFSKLDFSSDNPEYGY